MPLFKLTFPARTIHHPDWFGEMSNASTLVESVFVFWWDDNSGVGYGHCEDAAWSLFQSSLAAGYTVEYRNSGQVASAINPAQWQTLLAGVRNSRKNPNTGGG